MKFTQRKTETKNTIQEPQINYKKVEDVTAPSTGSGFKFKFNNKSLNQKDESTCQNKETDDNKMSNTQTSISGNSHAKYECENKKAQTSAFKQSNEQNDWITTNKILPKFVNKSARSSFGSAVEFTKSAFGLTKRNDNGYRESLDGKLLMNFWTFDKETNRQIDMIPAYTDISEWLYVCHLITSGELRQMTESARDAQRKGGYKYCSFIYQSIGGSYKPIFKIKGQQYGGNNSPIATLFKITPAGDANTVDKWTLSAEIVPGLTGETGLIEPKKGEKPIASIRVLMTYNDLVKVAKMSEIAIQAYMNKL